MNMLMIKIKWKINSFRRFWINLRYNIKIGLDASVLPKLGKGKYVSVIRKGDIIDVDEHSLNEKFRFIPYKENHGFMIEYWKDEKLISRICFDTSKMRKLLDINKKGS